MTPLIHLPQQTANNWLVGRNSEKLAELVTQFLADLDPFTASGNLPRLLLIEPDPIYFLARFLAACTAKCPVFLGNPIWVRAEWQQVLNLVQPHLIWGDTSILPCGTSINTENIASTVAATEQHNKGWIMIPTGGSSGRIRFAIHTWETLIAAVQGFREHFQVNPVNSFCVLPLHHVSGLMQVLRSFTSGGKLVILPFKIVEAGTGEIGKTDEINPSDFFISLVPTQLQRLLYSPLADWLSQFHTVLLGGAPAWTTLLQAARNQSIQLALTYGMTETAAQIATLKPAEFLANHNHCGQVLPHAQVTICNSFNQPLAINKPGKVVIRSRSLALGYYPETYFQGVLQLDDIGFLDEKGGLHIVGRDSDKIITGGENVFPSEVEAAIRATGYVTDVYVVGVSDRHWGQAITAVYTPKDASVSADRLRIALKNQLSNFKQPKHWIAVKSLPRNAQGKINREQLHALVSAWQTIHPIDSTNR
jgi:O-succinylbenzoic acid--CoA ligase